MRRREFMRMALGASLVLPARARAQTAKRPLRVGIVLLSPKPVYAWFINRLAELGYREGDTLILDAVQLDSPDKHMDDAYRELAARNPDILMAWGPEATLKAALAASQETPIVVVALDFDPVARGYVSSLPHPGGRVTGIFARQIEQAVKRLQVFRDAIPGFDSAIAFYDKASRDQWLAVEQEAAGLGVRVSGVAFRDPPYDYDRALQDTQPDFRKNLLVMMSPVFFLDRERLAKFALRNRLTSMFGLRVWVDAGGLMSYGIRGDDWSYKAADFVDRIARGANPADLPLELPTRFELAVNVSTARALSLDLPQSLLARADVVVE